MRNGVPLHNSLDTLGIRFSTAEEQGGAQDARSAPEQLSTCTAKPLACATCKGPGELTPAAPVPELRQSKAFCAWASI